MRATFASLPRSKHQADQSRWQQPPYAASKALSSCARQGPFRQPTSPLRQPAINRHFHSSAPRRRDHHFDTLKFVQRLQSEGFTEDQSVAMMKVLNDVIEER